jgi:hypothetical protein
MAGTGMDTGSTKVKQNRVGKQTFCFTKERDVVFWDLITGEFGLTKTWSAPLGDKTVAKTE